MEIGNVTPALHVRNEEYWIHYVLRDVLKVFGHAVMIDTGSTDATVSIAQATAKELGADLELRIEDMGSDANRIGNCPTMLREMVDTKWMLLVDGDEIWRERELRALEVQLAIVPDNTEVVMMVAHNVAIHDGEIMERETWYADRVFSEVVKWSNRTDYPFQCHGLLDRDAKGNVFRTGEGIYYYHVRHLDRSSKDNDAFFRREKVAYFPYNGEYKKLLTSDWIGDVNRLYPNPYLT